MNKKLLYSFHMHVHVHVHARSCEMAAVTFDRPLTLSTAADVYLEYSLLNITTTSPATELPSGEDYKVW